jgi:molybdopterin-guanine dinucleotide biosynthesis protein A
VVTGIVLAGGRSTRFGRDKLHEPYGGAPLLHHAILTLAQVCEPVLVVMAPEGDPDVPRGVPLLLQRDLVEGEGPLVALSHALANVHTPLALLVGGDMPELSVPVLGEMLRVADEADVDVVALQDGETFRPLPSVLRVGRMRPLAASLARDGERSLMTLMRMLRVAIIDEPTWHSLDPDRVTLRDVDRPEDLR